MRNNAMEQTFTVLYNSWQKLLNKFITDPLLVGNVKWAYCLQTYGWRNGNIYFYSYFFVRYIYNLSCIFMLNMNKALTMLKRHYTDSFELGRELKSNSEASLILFWYIAHNNIWIQYSV